MASCIASSTATGTELSTTSVDSTPAYHSITPPTPAAAPLGRLPRLAGVAPSLDLMAGGEPVTAARALELGLIDRLATGDLRHAALGSEGADVDDLAAALLDHHARGRLPLERLVTHFPFERINEAIQEAHTGAVIKPILRMGNR
mgnify:CR=1 FL=1